VRPLITVEGLKKSFYRPAGEIRVLKGLDAVFHEAEMVSIVGASGVGKSTFLHILGALDRPTEGRVLYYTPGGETVDPFSLTSAELAGFRNRTVGFVFQFHYLLPEFSAVENVMMPGFIGSSGKGRQGLRARAGELLEELGLSDRKDHKPGELSGGEQQRVAVARALLLEPRIVLADEPTGNLDAATGEELFSVLQRINRERGVTFILVTHNLSLAARCGRTMEMADGRVAILESRPPVQVT
jgi:lipoprotein-releasing system ATP-binding protein